MQSLFFQLGQICTNLGVFGSDDALVISVLALLLDEGGSQLRVGKLNEKPRVEHILHEHLLLLDAVVVHDVPDFVEGGVRVGVLGDVSQGFFDELVTFVVSVAEADESHAVN